jgi:hypothetical protein
VSVCVTANLTFVAWRQFHRMNLVIKKYVRIALSKRRRIKSRIGIKEPYNRVLQSTAEVSPDRTIIQPGQLMRFKLMQLMVKEQH